MSAEQEKPRFEPPPWEREAFDEFRKVQEEQKSREELNAALRAVREEPPAGGPEVQPESRPDAGHDAESLDTMVETEQAKEGPELIPQAKIDAMLIQLRGEEPPAVRDSRPLVGAVIAFMSISGAVILVQSALLFGDAQTSSSAGRMLAAATSFMVFATGLGFLGGAVMLYRKYFR